MKLIFSSNNVNGIQGLGLDVDNSKLIVFTVINTNDNENHPSTIDDPKTISKGTHDNTIKKISNNPPNPPYINTNVLKKFYNESKYIEMLHDYMNSFTSVHPTAQQEMDQVTKKYKDRYNAMNIEFMSRIKQYSFYCDDKTFQALITNGVMNINAYTQTEKIIEYIETNNETTFIGTLNFMNFMNILNPEGIKPICSTDHLILNETDPHNRTMYVDISKI
jgi:hypothetical protein